MKVIIDGDACPVLKIIFKICDEMNTRCICVHDYCHEIYCGTAEEFVVDKQSDSADFKIVSLAEKCDVVITNDYGLAALCLAKNCIAINFGGRIYDAGNIDGLLMRRHVGKKLRRAGRHLKGSPKRSAQEDSLFEKTLTKILSDLYKKL